MTLRLILIFAFGLLLIPGRLPAAGKTEWLNTIVSGNWDESGNWSAGTPNSDLDAVISFGTARVLSGSARASSLTVGSASGSGNLSIEGGSLVTAYTAIGDGGSAGSITVSGGTWTNYNSLLIGSSSQGTLTVTGGTVIAGSTEFGFRSGVSGTLNLYGGVYETRSIVELEGRGQVVFDGSTLRPKQNDDRFIRGFESGDLIINSGGAIFDTNGYSIGVWSPLAGAGPLVKTGSGVLTLGVDHGYTGATIVKGGSLVVWGGSIGKQRSISSLVVGQSSGEDASVTVHVGSISASSLEAGSAAGSKGTILIDIGGIGGGNMTVGKYGTGQITVNYDGGLSSSSSILGYGAGASGTIFVGGYWNSLREAYIGMSGSGAVSVSYGGLVQTYGVYLGYNFTARGEANVSGGRWINGGNVYLGDSGYGSLSIQGGDVTSDGLIVGLKAGSEGRLLIASTEGQHGTLWTSYLVKGAGVGSVTFEGGILRATQDDANFFSGFATGEVITQGTGAGIHTDGHNASVYAGISGTGQVWKMGEGTLRMEAASTYSGGTMVMEGTLANGNRAAFGTGLVTIDGGTLQAYDATIYGIALKSGTLEISPFGQSGLTLASGTSFSMTGGTWSLSQMGPGMHGTFLGDATNTFSITGGTLDLFGALVHTSISYQLFQGFGSGSVSGLSITGYDTTRYLANLGNDGLLTFAAVPESQTITLVLAGGLCLAVMHRRMRRAVRKG